MTQDRELIKAFWEIFFDCRNSALTQFRQMAEGRKLKNPDPARVRLEQFVIPFSSEDRLSIEKVVAHFVDAALFQLIHKLEGGEGPYDFELKIVNRQSGKAETLIGASVDHDLQHDFFSHVPSS